MHKGNVVYYLHGDHLSSTSLTTDAGGGLVSQARYLPYGETRWGGLGPTDFGFTSQRQEAGFGLYDYNARYYSPVLGRFISPDTVIPDPSSPQSFNRYAYVLGNPLRFVDPSGHAGCAADDHACWDSRWYRAHGYTQDKGKWKLGSDAQFDDPEILSDVLGENGIQVDSNWLSNEWNGELSLIGQGVVKLSNVVGGTANLKELVGGAVSFVRKTANDNWICGSNSNSRFEKIEREDLGQEKRGGYNQGKEVG
ncbi:MAG: RHS repeat-associated core domain-containing protein [Anaerolineae bacterium]